MALTISGRPIGPISLGMAGLTHPGTHPSLEDAIATLKAALQAGSNFWNAGTIYGTPVYHSLHLLNAYFTKYPEDAAKVVISVKGCADIRTGSFYNDAQSVRSEIDNCLEILDGKCRIDVFQTCRLDPKITVEETVGAIAEFVKADKIGGVGLTECSGATICKAVAVHRIEVVEFEMSLFETSLLTNGVADACKEFGIPIAAYSPLGKGFLTGQLQKIEDVPENDYRRKFFPRFNADNFEANVKLAKEVEAVAHRKGCTVAQVAIAWVIAQGQKAGTPIIPIPGASSVRRAEENLNQVQLTTAELQEIHEVFQKAEVKGARAPPQFSHLLAL